MKIAIRIRARADGHYVAHCPSLPGCVASARTREAAEQNMREAVIGYLASLNVLLPPRMIVTETQETTFR